MDDKALICLDCPMHLLQDRSQETGAPELAACAHKHKQNTSKLSQLAKLAHSMTAKKDYIKDVHDCRHQPIFQWDVRHRLRYM